MGCKAAGVRSWPGVSGKAFSGENASALIRAIRVKNFKTLRDVELTFAEGITVFVGANNSGKSNALVLLAFIARAATQGVRAALSALGGEEGILTRGAAGPLEYEVAASFDGRPVTYGLKIGGRPQDDAEWIRGADFNADLGSGLKWWGTEETAPRDARALYEAIAGIGVFDLSPEVLRRPSLVKRDPVLGSDGSDLAAVVDALPPRTKEAIDTEVSSAAPDVRKVLTRPASEEGRKVIGVEEASGEIFAADQLSDGLLLFIGLSTALQMRRTRQTLVAIEEPERGIHPRRLEQLVDQLWRLTENGTQVVLTTHSPLLLDRFSDYPESVVIFDRQGADTRITRLVDQPAWQDALKLKVRALGDIWYSGVLGGVPSP